MHLIQMIVSPISSDNVDVCTQIVKKEKRTRCDALVFLQIEEKPRINWRQHIDGNGQSREYFSIWYPSVIENSKTDQIQLKQWFGKFSSSLYQ